MTYTHEQILNTVKLLESELTNFPELNDQLQTLVLQAEKGEPVENEILGLLASDDRLREQTLNLLSSDQLSANVTKSVQLAGNQVATGSSLKYECQECRKSLVSNQVGREPKCPNHPNAQVISV